MSPEVIKAFVYLRVSGKGQVRGDGFTRQFKACREYAKLHNVKIVGIFREKGVSGKTELEDRPALSELFAALEENGVKTVLIEKVDRLARDLVIQETIIADMLKSGYTLLSSCEPDLCSEEPSRVLIRHIFGAIAQYDRAMTVLKLRGARQRKKMRQGKCEGRLAYGQKPGEMEILDELKMARRHGCTYERIAEIMNASKTPTRYGKPWHPATVAKILKRERVL